MEQLTKNQAVATSQEAVQNQNEPQLRDENAHNDKSVHGDRRAVQQECRDRIRMPSSASKKKRSQSARQVAILSGWARPVAGKEAGRVGSTRVAEVRRSWPP